MNDNLKVVSDDCFADSGIETVVLPKNLEKIGDCAFSSCHSLKCLAPNSELE